MRTICSCFIASLTCAASLTSVTLETPLPSGDCIPATATLALFFVSLGGYDGPAEDNDTRKQLLALRRFVNSPLANGRRVLVALSFTDVLADKIVKCDPKCAFADYTGTLTRLAARFRAALNQRTGGNDRTKFLDFLRDKVSGYSRYSNTEVQSVPLCTLDEASTKEFVGALTSAALAPAPTEARSRTRPHALLVESKLLTPHSEIPAPQGPQRAAEAVHFLVCLRQARGAARHRDDAAHREQRVEVHI